MIAADDGWRSFTTLTEAATWAGVADAYAAFVGAAHRPVGGACALQHWSGEWLRPVLTAWAGTGRLPDLALDHWSLRWDDHGAPVAMRSSPATTAAEATPEQVAVAIVSSVAPVVAAVSRATRITLKLGWGSVTTPCAGVLSTWHRDLPLEQRAAFAHVANRIVGADAWPIRPLLTPVRIVAADGERLAYERHTCCLIRLGSLPPCASCSDLPEDIRAERMTTAVRSLRPAHQG